MPIPPKKWKVKIGTKADASDVKSEKRFLNGHKSFTSAEARAMVEQQTRENSTLANFERLKSTYIRPRNPLCGEETPRDGSQMGTAKVDGFLLFPEDEAKPLTPPLHTMWAKRNRPKKASLKVGAFEEEEYQSLAELSPVAPNTSPPLQRELNRITAMRVMQSNISAELDFLYSKVGGRQAKIGTHLLGNMRATMSERDEARMALNGLK